jgi:hypothetical protein
LLYVCKTNDKRNDKLNPNPKVHFMQSIL